MLPSASWEEREEAVKEAEPARVYREGVVQGRDVMRVKRMGPSTPGQ